MTKQDYDTANGKDEFRFTNEYTTGVTITDNSLEMISPYRADAYGIEFLADKIGEDTTDNESDTDLFMVGVKSDSSGLKYILNRDYLMGAFSALTQCSMPCFPLLLWFWPMKHTSAHLLRCLLLRHQMVIVMWVLMEWGK